MNLWTVLFFVLGTYECHGLGIAEMISNYAKVAVNKFNAPVRYARTESNVSSTTHLPTTQASNETTEDEIPEYEDFDDVQETQESKGALSNLDSNTAMKYLNGVVNLLAMMYSFNGGKESLKPEKWHFGASRPRYEGSDPLADEINNLAQDRYNPTTATKKFKLQQGYSSVDTYPPYDPYSQSAAESYSSNGGKTSYDSDATMYVMKSPPKKNKNKGISPPSKIISPMEDYMTQNEPVDVQQSYSYQLSDVPSNLKPIVDGNVKTSGYFYDKPILPTPSPATPDDDNDIPPWMMKSTKNTNNKPSELDYSYGAKPDDSNDSNDFDNNDGPVYYPWMSNVDKVKTKPIKDFDDSPPWDSHPPPPEEEDTPVYYPWMSKSPPKKSKPMPPPPPPGDDDDNDDNSDMAPPPWDTKGKPMSSDDMLPPPSHKDPPPYYSYWQDHGSDHGHDHDNDQYLDDHHLDEEKDHAMKDEDRESKRPYTYYHLGRKLWYIPLLFSVYFIIYIGALILKSIARHKVQLPEKLWELHDHHGDDRRRSRQIKEATQKFYNDLDQANNKFM